MTERPILMSGPMVQAILRGDKTQTRRPIKPQPDHYCSDWDIVAEAGDVVIYRGWPTKLKEIRGRNKAASGELTPVKLRCPFGVPGDRLWLKETWVRIEGQAYADGQSDPVVIYRADGGGAQPERWRPSIHMPRWASRITLEVERVWAERVQDIGQEDAIAEGAQARRCVPGDARLGVSQTVWSIGESESATSAKDAFGLLWDSIYGPGAWERNDWVFACEFRRVQP